MKTILIFSILFLTSFGNIFNKAYSKDFVAPREITINDALACRNNNIKDPIEGFNCMTYVGYIRAIQDIFVFYIAETEEEAYCLSKNSVKNAENMIFAAYYAGKLKATDKMWILIPKTFQEMCFSKNHQQRMKNNFLRSFKGIYVND